MVEAHELSPAEGEDPQTLATEVTQLVSSKQWQICNNGKGLERDFRFKAFNATWVSSSFARSSA